MGGILLSKSFLERKAQKFAANWIRDYEETLRNGRKTSLSCIMEYIIRYEGENYIAPEIRKRVDAILSDYFERRKFDEAA